MSMTQHLDPARYRGESDHPMLAARAAFLRDFPETASPDDVSTLAQALLDQITRYEELSAVVDQFTRYEEASHGDA